MDLDVMTYEYLEHHADIGIKITANSKEEVFRDSALALFNIIYNSQKVYPRKSFKLDVESTSIEYLIIEYLNEILSLIDREECFFSEVKDIVLTKEQEKCFLTCTIWGEKQDKAKHGIKTEVKAATYSGLELKREKGNYVFRCLLDV